jgi:hypothetical protein
MRWAFVISLAVACGDDAAPGAAPSGAPSAGPIAEAQLLDEYTAAYCDTLGPCCGKYKVAFDKTNCDAVVRNALKQPFADAKARGGKYDADAAGKCIAAIRSVINACDASAISPTDLANAGDSRGSICRHIYSGAKKLGDPCDSTADCAQPAGTIVTCAASLCRAYQEGAAGAVCKSSYDEDVPGPYLACVDPLACIEKDGKSTCTQPDATSHGTAAEGAACKSDKDCASNRCYEGKCFTDKMGISPEACSNPLK